MGGEQGGRQAPETPRLPGIELDGPPDSATARAVLTLSDPQASQYAQAYDSFMVATKPQRDSAHAATEKMNDRLDSGDRAAAMFYVERLQDLGKYLKDRQDKFEDNLRHFLTGDEVKSYRRWKEDQQRAAEEKSREAALRWRQAAFGGGRMAAIPEQKTFVASPPGVARPDLGSQAVRVGRTVYVSSQLAVDSAGALVAPGDLGAQAGRAFANLAAVLRAAGAAPQDVVALTIYVVDYRAAQLAMIRDAGTGYFGANPPITTVLGVQSLSREGALIAVAATAVTGPSGFARRPARDRSQPD
jgi:enamine deaminase RidA (YjgF/YER057c/UK114 family)